MRYSLLVSLLVSAVVAGCGGHAEKADQQVNGQLVLPDYNGQSNSPLALTGSSGRLNFTGSLIVWDVAVTPAQIERISNASRDARVIKTGIVGYFNNEILPARTLVSTSDEAVATMQQERVEAIRNGYENSDQVRTVLVPVAENWFPKRVAELQAAGSIVSSDQEHIDRMFGAYCELKMWELAISTLSTANYKARPTPLAMCEPYYRSKQYFSDANLCAESPSAGGKNYFSCLWNDGVLKSELFVEKLDATPCRPTPNPADYAGRGAAIKAWVASGLLQALLSDNGSSTETKTYAQDFIDQTFSGTAYSRQLFNRELNGAKPYEDLGRCRIAFKREDLANGASFPVEDAWKYAKFDDLKFIVETTEDQASRATFKLIPSSGNQDQDRLNYKKLAWYILAFSERKASSGRIPASYSDVKFNRIVGLTLVADADHESRIRTDAAFSEFFDLDDKLVPAELKQKLAEAETQAANSKQDLQSKEETYKTDWLGKLFPNQQESIKAVLDPGATVLFNAFALNVIDTDGLLRTQLQFSDSKEPMIGCLALDANSSCEGKGANVGLSFDQVSGRLTVTKVIDQPASIGFMKRSVTELSTYFSKIEDDALVGKTLKMEFDLNKLGNSLEIFTGNTYIQDETGKTLFQGSQSGDNLSQRLSSGSAQ